jgi:hypothetical protein
VLTSGLGVLGESMFYMKDQPTSLQTITIPSTITTFMDEANFGIDIIINSISISNK